jgi:hypothetical protein
MFPEVFFTAKEVSYPPKIKENLGGKREIILKITTEKIFRILCKKRNLGGVKRNHLSLLK